MNRKLFSVAVALCLSGMASVSAARAYTPPPGTKVIEGNFFYVFVLKTEEKPAAAGYIGRVYQVTLLARTKKHGLQRYSRRIETLDADLLDRASWEVVDLDGDGLDDLRYLAERTKGGCNTWPALRWEKDRERFTEGGPQLARYDDGHGRKVPSCVLR